MDKKGIVVFSLLWLLSGCIRKPNDVDMYQRAIGYAQSLVDSGYITDDYVQLYELKTSEFSSIYSIFGTDTPDFRCSGISISNSKSGRKSFSALRN